jgi:hypothetical protein
MKIRLLNLTSTLLISALLSGCSLRPEDKVTFVVVEPGLPLEILEKSCTVQARELKSNKIGKQNIAGWYAMPKAQFDVLLLEVKKH